MTEFIARAKDFSGIWRCGYYYYAWRTSQHAIKCDEKQSVVADREFEVDKETVCWKCPDTPYFEHDVLNITNEFGEETIAEVYFDSGAFLVDISYGDAECLCVAELEDLDFKVSILGNTIDNPELAPHENTLQPQ